MHAHILMKIMALSRISSPVRVMVSVSIVLGLATSHPGGQTYQITNFSPGCHVTDYILKVMSSKVKVTDNIFQNFTFPARAYRSMVRRPIDHLVCRCIPSSDFSETPPVVQTAI